MSTESKRVILRPKQDKYLKKGYPWIFADQIRERKGGARSGDVVEIESADGTIHGLGLFHEQSQIAVRFLTPDPETTIDRAFFAERLRRALEFRDLAFAGETHFRLVHSESDGIPGTIIDRYGDVLCWSTLCLGMDQRRDWIFDVLEELLHPRAIIERNDHWLRAKDGLQESHGVVRGELSGPVVIREDDVEFEIDALEGPKTGFFIDQRLHRQAVRRYARGRTVLDAFCADGGFGLHAAKAGAKRVHCLDSSASALERLKRNAERNGVQEQIVRIEADALDRLGEMVDGGEQFDLVILDPPAFAKSRRHVEEAKGAYQRINISALRLLTPGGVLATSSCSQALEESEFLKIVRYSARKARTPLRLLERGSQPPDHPVLDSMPETHYLKFYVFQRLHDEVPQANREDSEELTSDRIAESSSALLPEERTDAP